METNTNINKLETIHDNISNGFINKAHNVSLEEVNSSISIPKNASFLKKLLAFMGPAHWWPLATSIPATGLLR